MTPTKAVIVLFGRKHTGKGTIATYLAENYGAKVVSFADLLKRILMGMLDMTYEQLYTEAGKDTVDPRYGKTPRWFAERLGTEGVQPVLGKAFWAKQVYAQIAADPHLLWVIDDGRFYHEMDSSIGGFYAIRTTDTAKEPITPTTHASDRADELAPELFDAQVTWARDARVDDQRQRILSAFTPVWEGLLKQRTALRETIGYMERQRALASRG